MSVVKFEGRSGGGESVADLAAGLVGYRFAEGHVPMSEAWDLVSEKYHSLVASALELSFSDLDALVELLSLNPDDPSFMAAASTLVELFENLFKVDRNEKGLENVILLPKFWVI